MFWALLDCLRIGQSKGAFSLTLKLKVKDPSFKSGIHGGRDWECQRNYRPNHQLGKGNCAHRRISQLQSSVPFHSTFLECSWKKTVTSFQRTIFFNHNYFFWLLKVHQQNAMSMSWINNFVGLSSDSCPLCNPCIQMNRVRDHFGVFAAVSVQLCAISDTLQQ